MNRSFRYERLLVVALLTFVVKPAFGQAVAKYDGPPSSPPEVIVPTAPAAIPVLGAPHSPEILVPIAPRAPKKVSRLAPRRKIESGAPKGEQLPQDGPPSFGPQTDQLTHAAVDHYTQIVRAGGWPVVPGPVGPHSDSETIGLLRRRLAIEGYLPPDQSVSGFFGNAASTTWDPELTSAVNRYEANAGLPQTGSIAGASLKAINMPASERLRALSATVGRLDMNASGFQFGPLYVAVNIPALSVEAIADGAIAHRYVAVVGGPNHQSPEIAAHVQAINVNPTWTLPTSIIKREVIPKLRHDPGYLAREHIRVLDPQGEEVDPGMVDWDSSHALSYTLRQDSGPFNSLGSLRINMPNREAVYMHDTPAKGLFERGYRFLSHGCVRVDGVYDLAAWLLKSTGDRQWDREALLGAVAEGERRDINLHRSVPVIWVYMTGWAEPDGSVHFRSDVYGKDLAAGAMAHAELH